LTLKDNLKIFKDRPKAEKLHYPWCCPENYTNQSWKKQQAPKLPLPWSNPNDVALNTLKILKAYFAYIYAYFAVNLGVLFIYIINICKW